MKRILQCAALLLAASLGLAGCSAPGGAPGGKSGRISVVTTLFPQYDFVRQITDGRADVTLLLPPGVESHTYEPTPADIITIGAAQLFIYTGPHMEPWAQRVLDGIEGGVGVMDLSEGIGLTPDEDGHADPHIWTSPVLAREMAGNIASTLGIIDPKNADFYAENAKAYKEKLTALDNTFREITENGERKEIVFAGRNAFHYFAEEYGLTILAAYDSCGEEAEPSARAVAEIIDRIREDRIPVVYYEELTDPKVARSISGETGAGMLLLHSCHNVSKEEFDAGATYLSLMEQNAQNLKEGLNGWLSSPAAT